MKETGIEEWGKWELGGLNYQVVRRATGKGKTTVLENPQGILSLFIYINYICLHVYV